MDWERWLSKAPKDQIEEVIKAVRIYRLAYNRVYNWQLNEASSDLKILQYLITESDPNFAGTLEIVFSRLVEHNPILGQYEELCLEAVKEDGKLLSTHFVKVAGPGRGDQGGLIIRQTPKICLAAVQQDASMLSHVNKEFRTPELIFEAVKENGLVLNHLTQEEQTERVCIMAFMTMIRHNQALIIKDDELKNRIQEILVDALQNALEVKYA